MLPELPHWALSQPTTLIPAGFRFSIHVAPAASTRTLADSVLSPDEDDEQRSRKMAFRRQVEELATETSKHVRESKAKTLYQEAAEAHMAAGNSPSRPCQLYMVVRRLVRYDRDIQGGVTMICCHANGLPVEGYYLPLALSDLSNVSEIWLIDAVNQGVSATMNDPNLGPLYSWKDHARDVVNFVEHVLPRTLTVDQLPEYLPAQEEKTKRGNVVAFGHSFGAAALVVAQLEAAIFSSMLLVEPMILKDVSIRLLQRKLGEGAIRRQSVWPSRSAARSALIKSPLFAAMDPRQLDAYIEYGLKPVNEDGRVTLSTPPWCEAATFADGRTSFETFWRLSDLKAGKGIHLVDAKESGAGRGNVEGMIAVRNAIPGATATWVKCGHLAIQERPEDVARGLSQFLERYGGRVVMRSRL